MPVRRSRPFVLLLLLAALSWPGPARGDAPPGPPASPADEAGAVFEERGVLTPRRTLVVEPSIQYSHSSSNRIALVGYTVIPAFTFGLIDARAVESNTFVGAVAARYGITNRMEAEARIPYAYRADTASTQTLNAPTPEGVFSAEGHGLGDVEFGLRGQLNRPAGNGPAVIGGVRVKTRTGKGPFELPLDTQAQGPGNGGLSSELPTGSGFWGAQAGLTFVLPSDPAVIFGSASYLWNVRRTIGGYGRVDPGDVIGINFGIGVALNENTSFSIGYDHNVVGINTQDGKRMTNSITTQVGTLLIGASRRLSGRTSLNISLGAGLTEAAPDVQFTVRMPVAF